MSEACALAETGNCEMAAGDRRSFMIKKLLCDLGMPAPQINWRMRRHSCATIGRSS
jgi:hypothetical protein